MIYILNLGYTPRGGPGHISGIFYGTSRPVHHYGVRRLQMTDKRTPTYDLVGFKQAFSSADKLAATSTALTGASALGLDRQGIVDAIQTMERRHFYKSMTSHTNSKVWQDVYHVPLAECDVAYVKFTADAITEFRLLSFKEK
jgi:motility quorum-sensing regulator/GCU-specific mRNA interferase toxin